MNPGLIGGFGGRLRSGSRLTRTVYASGTGTHVFNPAAKRARVTLLGGGGGGAYGPSNSFTQFGAGSGTLVVDVDLEFFPNPAAYIVGAGGAPGTSGTPTSSSGGTSSLGFLSQIGGGGDTNLSSSVPSTGSAGQGDGIKGTDGSSSQGGSSAYGAGATTVGGSPTGYGSGGAASPSAPTAGSGGLIIIEEYEQ
jgi:hypothetical protein